MISIVGTILAVGLIVFLAYSWREENEQEIRRRESDAWSDGFMYGWETCERQQED